MCVPVGLQTGSFLNTGVVVLAVRVSVRMYFSLSPPLEFCVKTGGVTRSLCITRETSELRHSRLRTAAGRAEARTEKRQGTNPKRVRCQQPR